jgi:DNA repair exonuclease SbcCD ATPase subunit
LGKASPLRELQRKLRKRMEGVEATCHQLAVRADQRSGTHQQALIEARQKMQELISRLRAGLEQIGSHIASIEAFLRECEVQIQALKEPLDDLPLLEQAASHEAGAEQELGQLEGVIMDSVSQLQSRMGETQARISAAMTEPAKQLFLTSDGADLEADLARYEQAASAAFPSALSPPDVKS